LKSEDEAWVNSLVAAYATDVREVDSTHNPKYCDNGYRKPKAFIVNYILAIF
jgi:hypothetical protein